MTEAGPERMNGTRLGDLREHGLKAPMGGSRGNLPNDETL